MRRKVLVIAAVVAAGMLVLTACTSSENTDMKEVGVGVSGGTTSGTGSQSSDTASQGSGTGSAGEADNTGDSAQGGQTVSGVPVDSGTTGSDTAAGGDNSQSGGSSAAAQDPVDGSSEGTVPGEFDGVYQDGSDDDETELVTGDIWTGVYGNDQETLTITYMDSKTISFTFAESGIYGKAEVNGYQAVYKGDDYHVVVFNIHDNIVDVSVSSEEDFDTSGSPLIGTYIKDYVYDAAEDATEADLNE